MQTAKNLPIIGTLMIVTATICTYAFPRLPVPSIHKIPVETFPRTIGEWQGGPDEAVDPEVQKIIPTATIISRVYKNLSGQTVELTLLSASQRGDYHDPNICFPAHGWNLSNLQNVHIFGERFNSMTAEQDKLKMKVHYKWMGAINIKTDSVYLKSAVKVRDEVFYGVMDRTDGMELFVRIMAKDDDLNPRAMGDFNQQIMPIVNSLLKQNAT